MIGTQKNLPQLLGTTFFPEKHVVQFSFSKGSITYLGANLIAQVH